MLKRTNSLPYVYTSINTEEFTTERNEPVRVDYIKVFNRDGVTLSLNYVIFDNSYDCVTDLPTILKRRGSVDYSKDIIQIVPSINERGETYKVDNKLVYTIFIPESIADLEYGIAAQQTVYSAVIQKMYFLFGGSIHSCYIVEENLGEKLNEYHNYFKNSYVGSVDDINELAIKAQEYKDEYMRVKEICDAFEPKHTENVAISSGGFISYKKH